MYIITEKLIPLIIYSGVGLVLLSPFPFGNVEIWSVSLFEIIVFLTFGAWLINRILLREVRLFQSPLYIPIGIFFLLIILQIFSLPISILEVISPQTSILWQSKSEAIAYIFRENIVASNTISLYPYVTKEKLYLYMSYAALFLVTAEYIRTSKQITRFYRIIFAVAVTESLIGLLQYLASGAKFPASGTYINPNHFAGLMLLIIPLFLGYILYMGARHGTRTISWHDIIKLRFPDQLLLIFVTSLMIISLVLAQSRGAIFSFAVSIFFFCILITWNKKSGSLKWLVSVFLVIIILYSLWIGLDPVIEKFSATTEDLPKRTYIWKDSINIIMDFPFFGIGLGNFNLAYTLYKKEAYWPRVYEHAHNDYIEIATETGVLGLLLVIWAIVAFYRTALVSVKDFSPRNDPKRYYLLTGCLSGMFGMLVHAITEFTFQVPSNTYYFIFLLGLSTSMLNVLTKRKKGNVNQ